MATLDICIWCLHLNAGCAVSNQDSSEKRLRVSPGCRLLMLQLQWPRSRGMEQWQWPASGGVVCYQRP